MGRGTDASCAAAIRLRHKATRGTSFSCFWHSLQLRNRKKYRRRARRQEYSSAAFFIHCFCQSSLACSSLGHGEKAGKIQCIVCAHKLGISACHQATCSLSLARPHQASLSKPNHCSDFASPGTPQRHQFWPINGTTYCTVLCNLLALRTATEVGYSEKGWTVKFHISKS